MPSSQLWPAGTARRLAHESGPHQTPFDTGSVPIFFPSRINGFVDTAPRFLLPRGDLICRQSYLQVSHTMRLAVIRRGSTARPMRFAKATERIGRLSAT